MTQLPLSQSAQEAVVLGRREAQCLGIPAAFTAHLLVGLLRLQDGAVEYVLAEIGLTPEEILNALELCPVPEQALPRGREPHLTETCACAIRLASAEADSLGQAAVGPEHLLLGLLRAETGWAGETLARLGADESRVRTAIRSLPGLRLLRATAAPAAPEDLLMRPASNSVVITETLLRSGYAVGKEER